MDLEEYRYSPEHMWVRLDEDGHALIGLTEEMLQDKDEITRLKMPDEGEEFTKDEPFGHLVTESSSVQQLFAPISGEVLEINDEVVDTPEMIMEDPYEEGWLLRISVIDEDEYHELMNRAEYEDYLSEDYLHDDDDVVDDDDEEYDEDGGEEETLEDDDF